jgi:leucyl/phenylalanyl-tRNA--protein transferase
MPIYLLTDSTEFPEPQLARKDGLLALGGDLSQQRLLLAYRSGIFPWYSRGEPILWWSPDPRLVLYPEEINISKSLKKTIKKDIFQITVDRVFPWVIRQCAVTRLEKGEPTWIVPEMIHAFCKLHESGYAHSIEAWQNGKLVGGLYGMSIGRYFSGESMFSTVSNASKVALVYLVDFLRHNHFHMVDCQVSTPHLIRFGAQPIPRNLFLKQLENATIESALTGKWHLNQKAAKKEILTRN